MTDLDAITTVSTGCCGPAAVNGTNTSGCCAPSSATGQKVSGSCCADAETEPYAKEALGDCCGSTVPADEASGGCCGNVEAVPSVGEAPGGCCAGAAPAGEEASGSCCGTPASGPAAAVSENCCGSAARIVTADIRVGLALADVLDDRLEALVRESDSWPYELPAWLAATERSLEGARPWHSVAVDGEDAAFLPGFVFDAPGLVDADPRTYLGWEPASGQAACCGADSGGASEQVDALGHGALFPALILGSPLGYRSDVVTVGAAGPQLTADLMDRLVPAAVAAGVRSIVAPWVADRPVNGPLLVALHGHGANISFWGEENHLPLPEASYEEHVTKLASRKRRRIRQDDEMAATAGVHWVRVDGEDLRRHVGRIAELTMLNRHKYDGGENASVITALLTALIDDGANVRAHLAFKGEEIVGSGVAIRQGKRLIVKWAGFDYEAVGERSGLYYSMVFNRPLRDAFAEGLDSLEMGAGADQAKRLRGCRPRTLYTALLVTDARLRDRVAGLQGACGGARRAALDAETAQEPEQSTSARLLGRLRSKKTTPDACCG